MYFIEYKELIKNLVISDLKTKYSSSVLGFAWSMLNPLLMMLVLYFVFSNVFKMTQEHFALYSVGSNLEDDGGAVAVTKSGSSAPRAKAGDWVWQTLPVTNTVRAVTGGD